MKTVVICISVLILLAGCNSTDTSTADESASVKNTTTTNTQPGVGKKTSIVPPGTVSELIQAEVKLDDRTVSASTELTTEATATEVTAEVKSPVDSKTFKRFTPDAAEIARKTDAHVDAKGPGLTATYRRITKPVTE